MFAIESQHRALALLPLICLTMLRYCEGMGPEEAMCYIVNIKGYAEGSAEEHQLVLESGRIILRLLLLVNTFI